MRKIYIHCTTGYVGSDLHEMIEVEDSTTAEELSKIAWEMAVENSSNYGYEEHSEECDCEECEENGGSTYTIDMCEGTWEEYDEEKHGMYIR